MTTMAQVNSVEDWVERPGKDTLVGQVCEWVSLEVQQAPSRVGWCLLEEREKLQID